MKTACRSIPSLLLERAKSGLIEPAACTPLRSSAAHHTPTLDTSAPLLTDVRVARARAAQDRRQGSRTTASKAGGSGAYKQVTV